MFNTIAGASDATFNQDGTAVYVASGISSLTRIDVRDHTSATVRLSGPAAGQPISSLSRSASGFILAGSHNSIFAYDPVKHDCVSVCSAPDASTVEDISYDPLTGNLYYVIVETRNDQRYYSLEMVPKNESRSGSVFCRRVPYVSGAVFDSDGRMFFGARGDLWTGGIVLADDEADEWEEALDTKAGPPNIGVLTGYRCAPLADFETYEGTPVEMGVTEVAVTGSYVYVAMSRIGGSGWGAIVRLKKPAPLPENGSAHFKDRLDLYTRLLETAEVLSETSGGKCWLCSSADGQRVFYKIRQTDTDLGPKLMLVEDDGVPREISLSDR